MRLTTIMLLLILAATAVDARVPSENVVDVYIVDRETGATLPVYPHRGERFVAGAPGHRYAIRLVNRTPGRVLTVLSVDGVNAVSGETASPDQAGYVLNGYESTEINGWRKSLADVAAFSFTGIGNSYAARTGRPSNVGVIGVAVFEERTYSRHERRISPEPPPSAPEPENEAAEDRLQRQDSPPDDSAAMAGAHAAERGFLGRAKKPALGTGHGARESAPVEQTEFERATRYPVQRVAIRYDRYENLAAAGIIPPPPRHPNPNPNPFPGGFVPDPPR